jgi:phage-related protein
MASKNNNKMNISYTIRAVDKFTDTHERLQRQLEALERQAAQLEAIDPDINVDADTGAAIAQVNALDNAIDRLPWYRRVWIHVEGVGNDHIRRMNRMATSMQSLNEIAMNMGMGSLITLLPALGPMLAITAGGAGALAGSLIGASAALGGFAMVAVPTIGYLREIDGEVKRGSNAWNKLSDGTRAALTELDKLRASWSKLQEKFREPTLQIFATNLQSAQIALGLFTPTIESSVSAVQELSDSLKNSLGSSDVKGIFEWLGSSAGDHLVDFVKGIGNFIVGFLSMMKAFEPLTKKFMDGFLNMSESFRKWASELDTNESFQDFLKFAEQNGPLLLEFIGSLTNFVVALGQAMSPVGVKVLELANSFLKWSTELLKNHEGLGLLLGVMTVALGLFKVLWPIIQVGVTVFKLLWPVITKVWSWFGKLQGVFVKILPWITRVATFILGLHPVIRIVMAVVAVLAAVVIRHWDDIKAWTIKTFNKVKEWISKKWDEAAEVIEGVKLWVKTVSTAFTDMYDSVVKWLGEMWDGIKGKWEDITAYLSEIDLSDIGSDIIQGLIDGINVVDVWKSVTDVASDIKNAFLNFFDVNSPSRVMKRDVGRWITLGVIDGMTSMASKAEREAEILANAIARPFNNMDKDFTYSANIGAARGAYNTATSASASTAGVGTVAGGDIVVETPVYLDGREVARGTYRHVSEYQDRDKARTRKFKQYA